jgi:membrane-anchored protein YejM (alkaline phosphatase superfamily)
MIDFAFAAESVLLITLDSCRYDTFFETDVPHLKSIGSLYRAMAPSHFTYGSHASMFVGFTPGVADGAPIPYANPKFTRIFKMRVPGQPTDAKPYFELEGSNIVEGFRRQGFVTLGTGAVDWFNPGLPASKTLVSDFDQFYYHDGSYHASLPHQLAWIEQHLNKTQRPVFLFLNIGETHVPYYYEGAPWDPEYCPCLPFGGAANDAAQCRYRQRECLRYVDTALAPLLKTFEAAAIVLCGDHGDCWGEDGLWEHGIAHEKVFEVPLVLRLPDRPKDLPLRA